MKRTPRLPTTSGVRLTSLWRVLSHHRDRHRTAGLGQVMGAVLWGFLGVRKDRAMARDVRAIKPAQLIVVGVLVAAVLVFTLMLIARLITSGL